MLRRIARLIFIAVATPGLAAAQTPDPVKWSGVVARAEAGGALVLSVRAQIENRWYVYSMQQPADGPSPLRFRTAANSGGSVEKVQAPPPQVSYDQGFKARVGKYYGAPNFTVVVNPGPSGTTPVLEVRYQACNDRICLPPRTRQVPISANPLNR